MTNVSTQPAFLSRQLREFDRIDVKRLAHMLRADMLAESYVPGEDIRKL